MARYCIHGHDTEKFGRIGHRCRQCQRVRQTTETYREARRIRENSSAYRAVSRERHRFWRLFTAMGITYPARMLLRKAGRL